MKQEWFVVLAVIALAVIAGRWAAAGEVDTSPPELPTSTAPAVWGTPDVSTPVPPPTALPYPYPPSPLPQPSPYPAPYPAASLGEPDEVYIPFVGR